MASLSFFQAPGGAHLALSGEKRGIAFAETPLLRVSFCAAEGGRGLEVSPPHPFLSFRARFRGCLSAEKVSLSLTATQLCIHFPKIWPAFACPSSSGVSLRPYDINSLSLSLSCASHLLSREGEKCLIPLLSRVSLSYILFLILPRNAAARAVASSSSSLIPARPSGNFA